ncbi:MAG: Rieske 2Fe-2S domain-containing protein [Legionella longbeachae]|nr:Rieske 2Fe-2S domain-containing protein [Legionella longbeachae]
MNIEHLKQQWFPISSAKKINSKPQRLMLLDMPLVVYRANNQIIVLQDKCPHRGAPLSAGKVRNGLLQCSYHGWLFNHSGECIAIPGLVGKTNFANKCVLAYPTKIHMGLLFVCLNKNENTLPLYEIPALTEKKYRSHFMQFTIDGDILNIIENTLDATHTHFVHSKLLRHDTKRQKITAELTVKTNSAEVCYIGEKQQSGFLNYLFEKKRHVSIGRFHFPLIAELEYFNTKELTAAFTFFLSPNTSTRHEVFLFISYQHHWLSSWIKKAVLLPLIKLALKQDLAILEKQEKNLGLFTERSFKSTELDILRPHITRILANENLNFKKTIQLNI